MEFLVLILSFLFFFFFFFFGKGLEGVDGFSCWLADFLLFRLNAFFFYFFFLGGEGRGGEGGVDGITFHHSVSGNGWLYRGGFFWGRGGARIYYCSLDSNHANGVIFLA